MLHETGSLVSFFLSVRNSPNPPRLVGKTNASTLTNRQADKQTEQNTRNNTKKPNSKQHAGDQACWEMAPQASWPSHSDNGNNTNNNNNANSDENENDSEDNNTRDKKRVHQQQQTLPRQTGNTS